MEYTRATAGARTSSQPQTEAVPCESPVQARRRTICLRSWEALQVQARFTASIARTLSARPAFQRLCGWADNGEPRVVAANGPPCFKV
ncbi:hypothetical protein FOMPIDRAFT_1022394 [Fomitopsis schrenkii]|uniref:Uncharacterized protein n=1 Tax=Fomitopsis schrenkii TaxID=2126942 RepID=S8FYX6_FOMSC|nr:hypothetical protein FOMPIDRAFT_1022394 [Fomitopsis schrenkii]